jgi:hypothetical protein
VQFSTVQCSSVQSSSVQCSSVQFSSVQFSQVQASSAQFSAVQCSSVQFSQVQASSVQFSAVQFIGFFKTLQVNCNCLHEADAFLRRYRLSTYSGSSQHLWNPNVHHRIHKSHPPVPILCQTNPAHTTPSCLSKIHLP